LSVDAESLRKGVEAMSRFVVGDATLLETLQRVSELACAAVSSADMVGVTMLLEGRPSTAAFTDDTALELDAAQYEAGSGPCLDAFRHHQVFRIGDVEKDLQWPAFSEVAAAHGVDSVLSVPLLARHEGVGALNFYSRVRGAFSENDVRTALHFATYAAILLANSQAYWDAHQLGQDLAEAMSARATVEQAKGIVIGARRCSADEAFEMLVRVSQRTNRSLHHVAEELVSKAALPQELALED
jgi:GAF domain-containing protein